MACAHGKVILLGEHAVVHGRPALALAIDRGVRAVAHPAETDELLISPWQRSVRPGEQDPLGRAFSALLGQIPARTTALRVDAEVELPPGGGLGCSAALGVAVLAALRRAVDAPADLDALIEGSLAWERVFHGNPSGVDSEVAARGGVILFRRGKAAEQVATRATFHLVLADTGERTATSSMVQSVSDQLARDPHRVNRVFDAIAALVQNGRLAAAAGDVVALGQLMSLNHSLLSSLLVSTERIEDLCEAARDAGAAGVKLTGGGGGGCVVAITDTNDHAARVARALEGAGATDVFVAHPAPAREVL